MAENPTAFPAQPLGSDGLPSCDMSSGMSLRDWFAGQAAPSALSHAANCVQTGSALSVIPEEWAAQISYAYADAMLAERSKSTTPSSMEDRHVG